MRPGPIIAAVVILSAGALAWTWVRTPPSTPNGQGAVSKRDARRAANGSSAVPVTVATVERKAVPVVRDGIGTVQALNTVTVRTQADGRLLSVEFTEGQMVSKGDVLARIDPTTYQALYDQAVAKKAQDEATLANARLDLIRYQKLAQTNAGPKQQADQQVALVNQLEAQVKSDTAAIANARAVLDYCTIVAPLDGRTGLRLVDPGNIVKASDSTGIVSITQIKPIAVVFTLPQRDLGAVNTALARGNVPVEVMEADGRTVAAQGTLQTVDNQIDVSTGTIKLKAVFPNEDLKLWPGQFVSARVVVDTLADARVVSTEAVRRGPSGTFVYVVGDGMKASVRPVAVKMQDAQRAVIGDGVDAGEKVVTIGFAQLADGKAVTIDSGANATGAVRDQSGSAGERKRGSGGKRDKGAAAGKPGADEAAGTDAANDRPRRRGNTADKPG